MPRKTFEEFMAAYAPEGHRQVVELDVSGSASPFIVVRCGEYTAIINPAAPGGDHLSVDVHPFVNGQGANGGGFGISDGRGVQCPEEGAPTSHGWPAAGQVTVVIGEQAG